MKKLLLIAIPACALISFMVWGQSNPVIPTVTDLKVEASDPLPTPHIPTAATIKIDPSKPPGSKPDSHAIPVPGNHGNDFNSYPKNLTPSVGFVAKFGNKAKKIWDDLLEEPLSNAKKSGLSLPMSIPGGKEETSSDSYGGLANKGQDTAMHDTTTEANKEIKTRNEKAYVSWKMREKCEGEKLVGFVAKTYDEKQALLKQTFVSIAKDDPFGCMEYRHPLSEFVPEDLIEAGFSGFLAITGLKENKSETNEAIWQNLIRPKDMSVGDQGIGSFQVIWDPSEGLGISGYKFYFGRKSGKYTHVVDVGKSTSFKVTGLALGLWYFTCTAYDKSGNESAFAAEVTTLVKDPRPAVSGYELPPAQ